MFSVISTLHVAIMWYDWNMNDIFGTSKTNKILTVLYRLTLCVVSITIFMEEWRMDSNQRIFNNNSNDNKKCLIHKNEYLKMTMLCRWRRAVHILRNKDSTKKSVRHYRLSCRTEASHNIQCVWYLFNELRTIE